jgi:hypothetical protein
MARPRSRAYPNSGTITIADGDTYPINVTGNFINVKTADQPFIIVLDGTNELQAAANRRFKLTEQDTFKKLDIVNNSGSPLTFQLEVGFGSIESDDVTIVGGVKVRNDDSPNDELQIKTKAGTELSIDSADIETKLDSVIAMLQDADDQRTPITDLEDCSYHGSAGTTTTIVTSGTNTNGVILRHVDVGVRGGQDGHIKVGSNYIFRMDPLGSEGNMRFLRDIKIPAGVAVEVSTSSSLGTIDVWYNVL